MSEAVQSLLLCGPIRWVGTDGPSADGCLLFASLIHPLVPSRSHPSSNLLLASAHNPHLYAIMCSDLWIAQSFKFKFIAVVCRFCVGAFAHHPLQETRCPWVVWIIELHPTEHRTTFRPYSLHIKRTITYISHSNTPRSLTADLNTLPCSSVLGRGRM